MRPRGGIIGASPTPATTSAGGIWTLREAELYKRDIALGLTYGPQIVVGDSNISSVALLMLMDGTGASFTDSSLTPKAITAVGNATQSAAQSKFGGKSAYFDGAGSRLLIPDNDAFYFGNGDYTVEAWLYITTLNTQGGGNFFSQSSRISSNANRQHAFAVNSTGLVVYWTTGGANDNALTFATTPPTNQWIHVAFARQSGVLRAYLNGAQVGASQSHTATYFNSTANVCVGSFGEYALDGYGYLDYTGYIDSLRITTAVARYTGATFTVPTTEFSVTTTSVLGVLGWPSLANPPTGVSGGGGNGAVALTWTAPTQNGGSAITDYVIQYSSDAGSTWTTFSRAASTVTSAVQVTGLTNGTAYVFRVAAVTAVGIGGYSAASASVTPAGSVINLAYTAGSWNGGGTTSAPFTSSSVFGPTNNAVLPFSFTANADADITFSMYQYNSANSDNYGKQTIYYRVNGTNYDVDGQPSGSAVTQSMAARLFAGEVLTIYPTGDAYGYSPVDLYTNISMSAVAAGSNKLKLLNAPFAITGTGTVADPFVAPTPLTQSNFPYRSNQPEQTIHFYAMAACTLYLSGTLSDNGDDNSDYTAAYWRVLTNSYAGSLFLNEGTTSTQSAAIPRGAYIRIENRAVSLTNLRFWAV